MLRERRIGANSSSQTELRGDPQALNVFWISDSLRAEPQPGSVQPSWPKVLESDSAPEPAPSPGSVGASDLPSVLPSWSWFIYLPNGPQNLLTQGLNRRPVLRWGCIRLLERSQGSFVLDGLNPISIHPNCPITETWCLRGQISWKLSLLSSQRYPPDLLTPALTSTVPLGRVKASEKAHSLLETG